LVSLPTGKIVQTVWYKLLETTKSKRYRKTKLQVTKLFLRKESRENSSSLAPKVSDKGLFQLLKNQKRKKAKN
jgi:hypothetical protein